MDIKLFVLGLLHVCLSYRWVHVLCAITVLEARFVNITERSPIDLSAIPLPRFRLVRATTLTGECLVTAVTKSLSKDYIYFFILD